MAGFSIPGVFTFVGIFRTLGAEVDFLGFLCWHDDLGFGCGKGIRCQYDSGSEAAISAY